MKRMLALICGVTLLLAAGAGVASAAPGDNGKAGPNDNNGKGLCTAYFNGQKNGHDKDGDGRTDNSPAFRGLEDTASEYDGTNGGNDEDREDEQQISDDVFEYCNNVWSIMGNPEQNGRFDCREGEDRNGAPHDTDGDGEIECDPIEEEA